MINNILDIYNVLLKASDNIKGETIDYNRGFVDAVYMLKLSLKKYEHINLHIENKNLRSELFRKNLALDDRYEDRSVLKNQVQELKQELNKYKNIQKRFTVEVDEFLTVKIEFLNSINEFKINCNQEEFDNHFNDANKLISIKYQKFINKNKIVYDNTIKCWFMEFYRSKGFDCIA